MKIYVATKFTNRKAAQSLMGRLRKAGHTITYDWTKESQGVANGTPKSDSDIANWSKFAEFDANGVKKADLLIVITSKIGGRGVFTELGIAIAMDKPVIVVGPYYNNIFYFMGNCVRVKDSKEAIELLEFF